MNGTRKLAIAALIAVGSACIAGGFLSAALAQDPGATKQPYTMPEYNAYQAACTEKNPQQQIKLLDGFVAQYPSSALLVYIYECYYGNYNAQKNYLKAIEYADKLIALGDKADIGMRYKALYVRALAFNSIQWKETDPATKDQAAKAREAALLGLKTLDEIKKPENMTDDDFNKQKLPLKIVFNYVAANAGRLAKDYANAAESYKITLTLTPNEPATWSQLGIVYLAMTPPRSLDGFWALARAVSLKGANEAQLKKYLRGQINNYQQPGCESLLEAELNELITLAGSSIDRPESYKLASTADLTAVRNGPPEMTIASVVTDLKAGGDKAKLTWLAACGLEFPDVPGKVLEVTPGTDAVVLKTAFVTSDEEFQAATTPNMEVKIVGQPEASRIEAKDTLVQFTGTLVYYDPEPSFMLHWDKAKVKPENIPEEKKAPVKKPPVRKPVPKKKPAA